MTFKKLQMFSMATVNLVSCSSAQTAVTHPQILTLTIRGEKFKSANMNDHLLWKLQI